MKKRDYDRLIGIRRHQEGGWEISYQQNGKKHSEYRRDEKEARLRAQYWKATLENPQEPQGSDSEHPVHYWERILRKVAELALSNPSDKDIAATCRSIASAATAAMRSAKYIPAPGIETSPDGAPVPSDISTLRTEDLEKLVGES
jgi:hypothetical protein